MREIFSFLETTWYCLFLGIVKQPEKKTMIKLEKVDSAVDLPRAGV